MTPRWSCAHSVASKSTGKIRTLGVYAFLTSVIWVLSGVADAIGARTLEIGILRIVVLPLLLVFMACFVVNVMAMRWSVRRIEEIQSAAATLLGFVAIAFILRAGAVFGTDLDVVFDSGWAMIAQGAGKVGTILAFPLALMLGMGRASVGATFSIGREPSIGMIEKRFGISADEGAGVMATYVLGTLLGPVFFAVLASIGVILGFDDASLAMACGAGSGGMTFSCVGSLLHTVDPAEHSELTVLATASDVLSYVVTIVLGSMVTIPLLTKVCDRIGIAPSSVSDTYATSSRRHNGWKTDLVAACATLVLLLLVFAVTDNGSGGWTAIFILVSISVLLVGVAPRMPRGVPVALLAAAAGALLTSPRLPWSTAAASEFERIDLFTMAGIVLGCAGFAINSTQLAILRGKMWRFVLVVFGVFSGSFFTSAMIAEMI